MLSTTDSPNPTTPTIAVKPSSRMDFLDVARGIAAGLVLVEHAIMPRFPGYEESTRWHGSIGRMGVILFLLVSGFIIPVSLEKSGSNGRFWIRRIGRLYPAYWLSVLLAFKWCWDGFDWRPFPLDDIGAWLLNLTMLQGFFHVPDAWGVFWTLRLELVIYVACSLLFALRLTNSWKWLIWGYIIAYAIAGITKPLISNGVFGIGGNRFLYLTPIMGVVAQKLTMGEFSRRQAYSMLGVHLLSMVAIWSASRIVHPAKMNSDCLQDFFLLWGVAYLILFSLVELRNVRMPKIACWFGKISYSVYLIHPFVLVYVARMNLGHFEAVGLILISTILFAQLSYWLLELPGISFARSLENRWFGPMKK